MLSRLISLLRRIPAVKWAFTRLRPLPHGGSIDIAPVIADSAPVVVAEAAPTLEPCIGADLLRHDTDITVAVPAAEPDTAASDFAKSPSAAPSDIGIGDVSSLGPPTAVEPVAVEEASISSAAIESEPADRPELIIGDNPPARPPTEVEPVVTEQVCSVDVATAPVDILDVVPNAEPSPSVSADIEPVPVQDTPVALVAAEAPAADVSEAGTDGDPAPGVALEIEPGPVLAAPAPEMRSAPKPRARPQQPVDRATLVRQRWAETGIRMWNPRLHGTGDATLNIQGRIELLPPAAGETMPRYDKLEFKMLGGQIVCEGVIVEAPAHASQRSFTRLAEPGKPAREPVRERQAALA